MFTVFIIIRVYSICTYINCMTYIVFDLSKVCCKPVIVLTYCIS